MARHPQFDEPATSPVRIRLTPTQRRDLDRVAQDERKAVSEVIREAINEFVGDYRENNPVFRKRSC